MGHSSSKSDPALKSLRFLLRSCGLSLTNSQALKTWEAFVKVAPWLPEGNLFDWDTWDRIEQLIHKAHVNRGEIPPLGTLAALKSCFPPRPPKGLKESPCPPKSCTPPPSQSEATKLPSGMPTQTISDKPQEKSPTPTSNIPDGPSARPKKLY